MFKSGMGAALALGLMAGTAIAGGFANRQQSTEAQGTSYAGAAAGTDGLSGMFWNPATLSNNNDKGLISETNVALVMPDIRADAAGTSSGNIGTLGTAPASYWSYGLTPELTLGVSLNAPLGSKTDADLWVGSLAGDKSAIETYNFNPAMAYKVGDWLTLGLGAQVEYMKVDINSRLTSGTEVFKTEGKDFGFGVTAGVLIQPASSTSVGLGFRSAVKHKLEGDGFRLGVYTGDVGADFTSPEVVTFGVQQAISEDFRVKAGVEWTNWSRFKNLTVTRADTGGVLATTPQNYKDGWFYSIGGEYDYNDALTLRLGTAYEKSPVVDAYRTPRTPDNDRLWLSAGASYQFSEKTRVNWAYSHILVKDAPTPLAPGVNATFKGHINIVSLGFSRDW